MKCSSCGSDNNDAQNFCMQCGANLNENSQQFHDQQPFLNSNPNTVSTGVNDSFLSPHNLSTYWYCPNDRTKMKNVQHKYVTNLIFWVSRNNLENSIQTAVRVYKIPQYAVNQTIKLAKAIFQNSNLTEIELVGVQCPTCNLAAAAPKLNRVESLGGNFGATLFNNTKLNEQAQNLPFYSLNGPLKPSGLLWPVIIAYSFLGLLAFTAGYISLGLNDITSFLFLLGLGFLLSLTACGLFKLNDSFRMIAIGIAVFFGFIFFTSFDIILRAIVAYSLYVLTFDKYSVFLFKEQARRKSLSTNY